MTKYVVVGGGIAGVACAEELCRVRKDGDSVTLVSASATIKGIKNYVKLTDALERFDVEERSLDALRAAYHGQLFVRQGVVTRVDAALRTAFMEDGAHLQYDKVCVCTGASPKLVLQHPLVVGLRDTQSAHDLAHHLAGARRVLLLGNGGIALGLVHALQAATRPGAPGRASPLQLVWAVRDAYAGTPFFDASASRFFLAQEKGTGTANVRVETHASTSHLDPIPSTGPDAAAGATTLGLLVDDEAALRLTARIGEGGECGRREEGGTADDAIAHGLRPLPARERPSRERQGGDARRKRPRRTEEASVATPSRQSDTDASSTSIGAPVCGSSLGPAWMHVLSACGVGAGVGDVPSSQRTWGGSTEGGVVLETCVEAVAIRGAPGSVGAVGALADGRWHPLPTSVPYAPSVECEGGGDNGCGDWPLTVRLSSGMEVGVDLLISATGVTPSTWMVPGEGEGGCLKGPDGALLVNSRMQCSAGSAASSSSCPCPVFAAGDAASLLWPRTGVLRENVRAGFGDPVSDPRARPALWFQMRLWTQARVSGAFAARCMAGALDPTEEEDGGVPFELFAHASSLMGHKVVLLGTFNGQGLGMAYERALRSTVVTSNGLLPRAGTASSLLLSAEGETAECGCPVQVQLRVTPGVEYAKVVLLHGQVVGSLLVGQAAEELGETLENLILNRTDVRVKGEGFTGEDGWVALDLLNPDIDIGDYFD